MLLAIVVSFLRQGAAAACRDEVVLLVPPAVVLILHSYAHARKPTDPCLAARERLGHLCDAHVVHRELVDNEPGLLDDAECLVLGDAHQGGISRCRQNCQASILGHRWC